MFSKVTHPIRVLAFLTLWSAAASAQVTPPTPAQAQQALNDPGAIARLQQMMQSSGLTPDQIRDRLRAQGYPDSLLDQYLPGAPAGSTGAPGDDVYAAIRALGISDSATLDSLSGANGRQQQTNSSAFLDTLRRAANNDSTREAIRALLASRSLQRQARDSGFKVFGADLFQGQTSLFAVNRTGGVDPAYRFGPGDQLVLFLTGDIQKSYSLQVNREGFVVVPDVGQVSVAGLTRTQLEDALYGQLGRVYSGVRRGPGATTRFYLNVSEVGVNQIFVNGDVVHPGSYRVSRAGTVLNALYLAGGPSGSGSMRNVQVRRGGQTVATLDFYDYALRGDASNDVRLENGDIVFVQPRGPQVRVAGDVTRPATYELKPNATLADVIQMAGGFRETADRRIVQIDRVVPLAERTSVGSDRKVVDVPADLIASAPVRGGDVVKVHEIARRVGNRVTVTGNVWTPGVVGFVPGMRLSAALRGAGGLKPDSYLGQVLVAHLRPDSSRVMARTAVFDTTGRAVNDIELSDGDEISVFSITDFRTQQYITVNGAVRHAGPIPFRRGMTMRDAILLAGGVTEGALLNDAEIARLPENRAAGVTATTQLVPLDSSYLFERGSDGRVTGPPGIPASTRVAPEILLEPYDAILIKQQPEWQLQQTVNVQGEVRYPGAYSILNKQEKLSDLIQRAGGLSSAAYAGGIVYTRSSGGVGRIGVDLPRVLEDPHYVDNLQLVDGDLIFIPRYTPVVAVRGAVNAPVGVAYVAGANLSYYIRSAGGESIKGDGGRAYVTQPNGKVETRHKRLALWTLEPRPLPGSTILVPEKDPLDKHDWAQIATAFTSIMGTLIAIAALVRK